jgi:hypothetical protein
LFAPQALNAVQPGDRVSLRIESGSRRLQLALLEEGPSKLAVLREARLYELLDAGGLRSLAMPAGGRRSAALPGSGARDFDEPERLQRHFELP